MTKKKKIICKQKTKTFPETSFLAAAACCFPARVSIVGFLSVSSCSRFDPASSFQQQSSSENGLSNIFQKYHLFLCSYVHEHPLVVRASICSSLSPLGTSHPPQCAALKGGNFVLISCKNHPAMSKQCPLVEGRKGAQICRL